MNIHHIGYVVKSIEKAKKEFNKLGFVVEHDTVEDSLRDIYICFMINGNSRVELVEPKSKESVVAALGKKIGNSPYHLCYEVSDIECAVSELEEMGYMIIQQQQIAPAIDGKKVAFLFNGNIGLLELVEEK